MATPFQRIRVGSLHFLLFVFLLFSYVIIANIFFVKSSPVLYITPIVAAIFFKKNYTKFIFFNMLIFSCGFVEDILASRLWGMSGVFFLLLFSIINLINEKFVRNLAKYIVNVCGLILYTAYEILSLMHLRSKYYTQMLSNSEIIILQTVAFLFTLILISLIYSDFRKERRVGRISVI